MDKLTTNQYLNLQSINVFAIVASRREVVISIEKEINYIEKKILVREKKCRLIRKILKKRRRYIATIKAINFISEKITKLFFEKRMERITYCENLLEFIENDVIHEFNEIAEEYKTSKTNIETDNIRSYNFITKQEVNSISEKMKLQ